MPFVPLHDLLPDLAQLETRTATIPDGEPMLPADTYYFHETYCDELDCDCRRVLFLVRSLRANRVEAVIGYGWESSQFYANWLHTDDADLVREVKGPMLNPGSPASPLAPALVELCQLVLLEDEEYVARLRRHYRQFREALAGPVRNSRLGRKVGRNERCPCGSGRKWKVCCGRGGAAILPAPAAKPAPDWLRDIATVVDKAKQRRAFALDRGNVVLFSTADGDAWMVRRREQDAAVLARAGEVMAPALQFGDDATPYAHPYRYRFDDGRFVVIDKQIGTVEVFDYGQALLAALKNPDPDRSAADGM